jgi:Tfp pilus assembly protein PilV
LAWDVLTHFFQLAGEGRMRTFIFALAAIVPAFAIDRAGTADELPAFDIARNCKAETADASVEGPASCTKDETDAKNQLAKRWSSYSASQKKECVGESTTGGEKSYVELLTCLEMSTGHFSTGADPNR